VRAVDLTDEERKRRARAALGYSLLSQQELAAKLGESPKTFANWLGRTRNGPDDGLLFRIADACDVPRAFMEEGFAPLSPNGLRDEVAQLREQVAVLQADLATLDLEVLQRIVATATPKAPPQQGPPQ